MYQYDSQIIIFILLTKIYFLVQSDIGRPIVLLNTGALLLKQHVCYPIFRFNGLSNIQKFSTKIQQFCRNDPLSFEDASQKIIKTVWVWQLSFFRFHWYFLRSLTVMFLNAIHICKRLRYIAYFS